MTPNLPLGTTHAEDLDIGSVPLSICERQMVKSTNGNQNQERPTRLVEERCIG